jgi:hypothetical protein
MALSRRYIYFMEFDQASATRSVPVARSSGSRPAASPRSRSAVSNGKRLHVVPPGDTKWARRFRDVLAEIVSDLGGADQLSEGQRQLARRAATISLECERLEARAVTGEAIDLEVYGQLTDRLGRTFGRLGLKRVATDVTPTLAEYLAERYPTGRSREASGDFGDREAGGEETCARVSPRAAVESST